VPLETTDREDPNRFTHVYDAVFRVAARRQPRRRTHMTTSPRNHRRTVVRTSLFAGTSLALLFTGDGIARADSPDMEPQNAAAPTSAASLQSDPSIHCTTSVNKRDITWAMDKWSVNLHCTGNSSNKDAYVRGVLDVAGALDVHTKWIELPATSWRPTAKAITSFEANSPWGDATSRIEKFQCPPVVIGKCAPENKYGDAIISLGDLL
jgi:hypothetical protein